MSNKRSDEAKLYRRMYQTKAWKDLRHAKLQEQPFCEMCLSVDRTTSSAVVDHIVPHRGDEHLFHDYENLQALCKECHDYHKRRQEMFGYSDITDADGYPIDPRHPANQI